VVNIKKVSAYAPYSAPLIAANKHKRRKKTLNLEIRKSRKAFLTLQRFTIHVGLAVPPAFGLIAIVWFHSLCRCISESGICFGVSRTRKGVRL
jgi:hypothetical protein